MSTHSNAVNPLTWPTRPKPYDPQAEMTGNTSDL